MQNAPANGPKNRPERSIHDAADMMVGGHFYLRYEGESLAEAVRNHFHLGDGVYGGFRTREDALDEAVVGGRSGQCFWIVDAAAGVVCEGVVPANEVLG